MRPSIRGEDPHGRCRFGYRQAAIVSSRKARCRLDPCLAHAIGGRGARDWLRVMGASLPACLLRAAIDTQKQSQARPCWKLVHEEVQFNRAL